MSHLRIFQVAGFAILSVNIASAQITVYSTGDFTPSEWTSHISEDSTGSSSASTSGAGGNPGAYRRVSLSVDPFEFVRNVQLWENTQYSPSTQGAITEAVIAYDITRISTTHASALQIAKGIAVQQDGEIYTSLLGVSTVAHPTWEDVNSGSLLSLFPEVNWVNGETITFGFFDSVGTSSQGFTLEGGYDNFTLTLTHIPEPHSSALLIALITSLAALKRRPI